MTIRLRGHHIPAAFNAREASEEAYTGSSMQQKIYGREFLARSHRFLNEIPEDALIMIVNGVDDLCELGCPFYNNCKEKRYDINMDIYSRLFPEEEVTPENFNLDAWDRDELESRGLRKVTEILFKNIRK